MGGHAFMRTGQPATFDTHLKNAAEISARMMTLIERDYDLVITHGNGPQVGMLMQQTDIARDQVPTMPLDVLVADTQGWLGHIMQQEMLNQLRRRNLNRFVVTMVTQVEVDKRDPAFLAPTKPVGRFMSEQEARAAAEQHGWEIVEDSGRGWRRVVPSPRPQRVVQWRMIQDSARHGHIVIAGGGGGIPIIKNSYDDYVGVEAVIDKDLTSGLLASSIGAELLVILTDVPHAYVNYGKPNQQALGAVTAEEAEKLVSQGHFAPGSMGPKVQAIQSFLKRGGRRALITDGASLELALEGRGGTHFVGRL